MRTVLVVCIALLAASHVVLAGEAPAILRAADGEPGGLTPSLRNEARAAIDRGTKWLIAQQNEAGYWSTPEFPAMTALPVWALVRGGVSDPRVLDKAIAYIRSCVHENGAIYREPDEQRKGGGLSTYNTAICMIALHEIGRPELTPIVQKARQFVAKSQHLGGDVYRGGMGYDPSTGRPYADLSNSYIAYEAMKLTEDVEDLRTEEDEEADLDWEAAKGFLDRVQTLPIVDPSDIGADPDEEGGFIYRPDESKAGTYTDNEGVVRFRSYGSMTYAGLLSLIYADVDRSDARVKSAFGWAEQHWSLDENPGVGAQGLYYFYNVLSKALAVYGRDQILLDNGTRINWRTELARKLIALQKIDPKTGHGYWVNENGRWWEADPVLVTSYSLLALEIAAQ